MSRWVTMTLKAVLLALFGIVLYATNDTFIMVGGSDSTSFLLAPSIALQSLAFAGCTAYLVARLSLRMRAVLLPLAVGIALLCSHRLVVDNLHDEIRDVYMAMTMQRLALDATQEGGLFVKSSAAGFQLGQVGGGRTLWIFSPGVIGIDRYALERIAGGW